MNPYLNIGEEEPVKKRLNSVHVLGALFVIGLAALGTTLAAQITLNSNKPVEFGQGVTTTAACDTNGIKVSPIYSYVNRPNPEKFTFNALQLEHISSNCAGKEMIIKVYDASGAPIPLTIDQEHPQTSIRIYFHSMTDALLIGDSNADVSPYGYWGNAFTLVGNYPFNVTSLGNLTAMTSDEPISGHTASDYFALDPEENSVQISLDPNGQFISGFSDSRNIYKITLESVDHIPGS